MGKVALEDTSLVDNHKLKPFVFFFGQSTQKFGWKPKSERLFSAIHPGFFN